MSSMRPPRNRGTSIILRAYNSNLRPVVIVVALISAIWSLVLAISSFRTISVDKDYGTTKLATFAVIVGSIYAGVCGIEVFGITAAALQRLWLARIYALLSVVIACSVVGVGLMRVIIHFVLKNDLISECTKIATGDVVVYRYGFWSPTFEDKLTGPEAETYCKNAWNHDSFVEIISFIIEILLSAFFSGIAFAYYHQLLDPTSAANVSRAPPTAPRDDTATFPAHYNPPYLSYDAPPYAPPAGAPAGSDDYGKDDPYGGAKPPMYSEDDLGTYGGGAGDKDRLAKGDDDDPFADFDGPSKGPSRAGDRLV